MDDIGFYKAQGEYGFMSNMYLAEIEFEGKRFRSSEDAYQYGKFADKELADIAMTLPAPRFVAILAHGLFLYDMVPDWNLIKIDRMKRVLRAKFDQHPDLKLKLIATGYANLFEDSKTDAFWGVGKNGTGKNVLGKLLMELRDKYVKQAILDEGKR
jgi:hypothetical protein